MNRRAVRCIALVCLAGTAALGAGCGAEQDPGVGVEDGVTPTTSRPLPPCPPGGPDESTPPAGCIGPDGEVLR